MTKHKIVLSSIPDPDDLGGGVAVVQWEGVDPNMLRDKVTAVVKEWRDTTKEGKAAWEESDAYFNMQDLSEWLPAEDDLARLLNKHGIRNLTVEIISHSYFARDWDIGVSLVDERTLPDVEED